MTQFRRPRWYRDSLGGKWVDGEYFMGRNRIPPMPNRIALTDRTTGIPYVLGQNGDPGGFQLIPVDPRWPDVTTYGPYDGPYSGDFRLFLDNGTLAFEPAIGYSSSRILTRNAFYSHVIELTVDPDGVSVVYTNVTL